MFIIETTSCKPALNVGAPRADVTMVPMTPGDVTAHAQTETAPSVSRSAETRAQRLAESRNNNIEVCGL